MSEDRQPPIERHLTEEELSEAIDEAEQADEPRLVRRLCFIKNLYAGDAPEEAAVRVGMSQSTSSHWRRAWNDHGLDGLRPSFGAAGPRNSPMRSERGSNSSCKQISRGRRPKSNSSSKRSLTSPIHSVIWRGC